MGYIFALLFTSLLSINALYPEDIPLQIVNSSPAAKIESVRLTVDKDRQVFSYSQVLLNTSSRNILNVTLELKAANMIEGYVVNSTVHVERIETRIAPNARVTACVAEDAQMPAFLKDVSAGSVSILRVEFEDGSVWEPPKQ